MRLKLTLVTGGEADDISVSADATTTVGQLAERLRASHPRSNSPAHAGLDLCIRVNPGTSAERSVAPGTTLDQAGVRGGDSISLTNASTSTQSGVQPAATVRVISGPDAGKSFSLPIGTTIIGRGRDCDIRLNDPLISKRHMKASINDAVEVIDDNSANGVFINSEPVQRGIVRSGDRVVIGATELAFSVNAASAGNPAGAGSTIAFNRSPRLDPKYPGVELVAPEPPDRPQPQRFPWITIIAPILMGTIMYSITKNILSILFIGLSPIMIVGAFYENRRSSKKALREGTVQFRAGLRDLAVQLQFASETEREVRRHEHPSVNEISADGHNLGELLWTRRPEHDSFAQIRLGLGSRPSRNSVKTPDANKTIPELWKELQAVVREFSMVDRVPVVADLRECGNIGVAGPTVVAHPIAAATIAQFVGLHSPAELVVAAVMTPTSSDRWEWLKWLPHAGSEYSPVGGEHLASSEAQVNQLIAELEELVRLRDEDETQTNNSPIPLVLIVVEDDAAESRARLVQLAERGPAHGIHFLWVAPSLARVPAACRTYIQVDASSNMGRTGYVKTGEGVEPVELEPIRESATALLAKSLSPVIDSGALLEDQSDLPRSVSFLTLAGDDIADSPSDVIEHWRGNNSIPEPGMQHLKRDNNLRALVGQSADGRCYLDLRAQGPHALVGGTTGAGKSEFLQSWILGLASVHSAARVNFLFVDYKGGAAFADCVDLPHCVGLVTDLSPHLVRRALRSLNAELRRREHILNSKKAKDLLELERRRDPDAPASLVIIVDEFAALISEVPEFVDGVVNVAQRGRSLGLHLILATQRPAGVIKDNLRANTNLRVALRMADDEDSTDVVGSPVAGAFDPSIPGRGVAKTGPGRLTNFQSAYVGGHTSSGLVQPNIDIHDFHFGLGRPWDQPDQADAGVRAVDPGPTDIRRLVDTISAASSQIRLKSARKPWLPELSVTYTLEDLPSERTDDRLVYGVIDKPDEQAQPVIAFEPDRDGNMAVFGTGGSGKSTLLRSIAVAAGFAPARGGPCYVYAIDCGARGLAMIEQLPHVGSVIVGDDAERTARLLKGLRSTIDERAGRYAAVNASTIVEYRARSGESGEPRILLLIDNFSAFRQEYETGPRGNPFEVLEGVVADGRAVGVHLVVTADRANALTTSLRSVIQSQLSLRLSSEGDLMALNVPLDVFNEQSPAGRGFLDESDVQVAVLAGTPNVALQAAATSQLAEAMSRAGVSAAPPIERLGEQISLSSLPSNVGGNPVLGVWDETLRPMGFEASGVFVVAGPPQSGKTSTVSLLIHSVLRSGLDRQMILFGPKRSQLTSQVAFETHLTGADDVAVKAAELTIQITSEGNSQSRNYIFVLESLGEYAGSVADEPLQELLKACRSEGHLMIVEGEVASFSGNWGLPGAAKSDRTGIVLQPDQTDGDVVLNTEFPRVRRADFPTGRGLYARSGRVYRVQIPLHRPTNSS